jgi:hypothetical protein
MFSTGRVSTRITLNCLISCIAVSVYNLLSATAFAIASFKVSITNLLSLCLKILYETTCLSYKSIIVDKYALAPLNIKYVTSVSQTLLGAFVLKFLKVD